MNKKLQTTLALIGASLLFLPGCSTSSSVVTGTTREPVDPAIVTIHRRPPPVYEEIGMVSASSKGAVAFTEQEKSDAAIARLKEEAAKLGANGVLLKSMRDGSGGTFSIGVGTGSYGHSGGASVGASTSGRATYKMADGIAIWVPETGDPADEEASVN